MYSKTIMLGRLTADPQLRYTPSNIAVCTFSIAVDRSYKVDGKTKADFFQVIAWRTLGEHIAKYFKKGKPILIDGHMENRSYEDKDSIKHYVTELIADRVSFTGDQNRTEKSLPVPPPEYKGNETADFAEVSGNSEDLPF